MQAHTFGSRSAAPFGASGAAAILLAADDVAVRLTLEAVLTKSGYLVDSAISSAEAMEKIETGRYALVLCSFRREPEGACQSVIQVAKAQAYRPATAVIAVNELDGVGEKADEVLIEPVDVAGLLTQIADLLADRAYGRAARGIRRKAG